MTHGRAYSLLFLVTLLWAGNYPFGKLALTEMGPITLTAARRAVRPCDPGRRTPEP